MNCRDCRHCHREYESWELPHIWWFGCAAKPAMANLKSFPFKNTDCDRFEQRQNRPKDLCVSLDIDEALKSVPTQEGS